MDLPLEGIRELLSKFKSPRHKLLSSAVKGRDNWRLKAISYREKLRNEELKKNYHHERSLTKQAVIKQQTVEIEELKAEVERLKKNLM